MKKQPKSRENLKKIFRKLMISLKDYQNESEEIRRFDHDYNHNLIRLTSEVVKDKIFDLEVASVVVFLQFRFYLNRLNKIQTFS